MARTRRFKRGEPLPMSLTSRDRAIIEAVGEHRFLDSGQIHSLIGGSAQPILRRLQRLFHAGYLDRPLAQLRSYAENGSPRPMVYEVGCLGKRLLADPTKKRRSSGKAVGQLYLDHTLLVAAVTVAFLNGRRFPSAPRLRFEAKPGDQPWPTTWTVPVRHGGAAHRLGVCPDKILAVEGFSSHPRPLLLLFVEADRGTMPIVRRSLKPSSFLRKLLAYEATWEKRLTEKSHGIARFRVLTVTATPARARHLAAACTHLTGGRGLFLFTDAEALKKSPNIYEHRWLSGSGGEDRILGR